MGGEFKNKAVRDLAWAISSVGLLNDLNAVSDRILQREYMKFQPQLNQLDKDPVPLVEFLASKNTKRLGHYFEQLVFFWLEQSSRFTVIAKNLPIRTELKHTLGEVDLITYDKKIESYQHWELAVKFYLAHNSEGNSDFIGPNANDYLDIKLKKLKDHQCKILNHEEGQKALSRFNISKIESKLFIKGCLYYHPKQNYASKKFIHSNHNRSWWIHLREADEFLSNKYQFALIHKGQWLSTPLTPEILYTKKDCLDALYATLSENPRSLHVTCYDNSKLITQGFVTRDTWPDI